MLRSRPPAGTAGGRADRFAGENDVREGGDGLAVRTALGEEQRCAEPHLEPPSGHWIGFLPQSPAPNASSARRHECLPGRSNPHYFEVAQNAGASTVAKPTIVEARGDVNRETMFQLLGLPGPGAYGQRSRDWLEQHRRNPHGAASVARPQSNRRRSAWQTRRGAQR